MKYSTLCCKCNNVVKLSKAQNEAVEELVRITGEEKVITCRECC